MSTLCVLCVGMNSMNTFYCINQEKHDSLRVDSERAKQQRKFKNVSIGDENRCIFRLSICNLCTWSGPFSRERNNELEAASGTLAEDVEDARKGVSGTPLHLFLQCPVRVCCSSTIVGVRCLALPP